MTFHMEPLAVYWSFWRPVPRDFIENTGPVLVDLPPPRTEVDAADKPVAPSSACPSLMPS